jgi:hypothetical protein
LEETSDLPWLREPVRLLASGQTRYLLDVRRERCPHCATGTRVTSLWVCGKGKGESVAWCGHCFNAVCRSAPLNAPLRDRFRLMQTQLEQPGSGVVWPAARPALEDLERRGLL